jgi:hypothetical protein
MSFSISFGPVSVADIAAAADEAYSKYVEGVTDPEIAEGGDRLSLSAVRFNDDQRYMAKEALRLVVDTVLRGNLGTEHGDAVDEAGTPVPADCVNVVISGHGRRLAIVKGKDNSAAPMLSISITNVAAPAVAVVDEAVNTAPLASTPPEVMAPTA